MRFVFLMTSLKLQKIVISAAFFCRKLTANRGSGFIDSTAPHLGVEKLADFTKVLIFFALHDPLVAVVRPREPAMRYLGRDTKKLSEPQHILLFHGDHWI